MSEKVVVDGKEYDGFISAIEMPNGKTFALKCAVVTAYPISCPKCGSSFELRYGSGRCEHCGTYFTTQFKVVEESACIE